jgi:hypothetical protein
MPRGDRTGPAGIGPMTGRAAGRCGGADAPGYASSGFGRGHRRGFGRGGGGRGRGFGGGWRGFAFAGAPDAELDDETESRALKDRAAALRGQLRAIESRLAEGGEEPEKPETPA